MAYSLFSLIRGTSRSDHFAINVVSTSFSSSAKISLHVKVSSNGLDYKIPIKIHIHQNGKFCEQMNKILPPGSPLQHFKFLTHKYHTNLSCSGEGELCCPNIKLLCVDVIGVKGVTTCRNKK